MRLGDRRFAEQRCRPAIPRSRRRSRRRPDGRGVDAARCDHRHRHRIGNRAGEREVIAVLVPSRSMLVDEHLPAPSSRKVPRWAAYLTPVVGCVRAMGEDFPLPLRRGARRCCRPRTGCRNAWAMSATKFGARHRGAVHRDLVGAREEQRAHVGAAHAAADGQGYSYDFGGVRPYRSSVPRPWWLAETSRSKARRPSRVIDSAAADRDCSASRVDEIDALHDAPISDVEAGITRTRTVTPAPPRSLARSRRPS